MKKTVTLLLTLLFSLGLFHTPLKAQEAGQTYTYNNGGQYLDKTTVPQGNVVTGSTGQIRPLADSLIKDTQYAFKYKVSNPAVLSIDERGNWQALAAGTATITIHPVERGYAPLFDAELEALGIQPAEFEATIGHLPQTFTVNVSDNTLTPVGRLYHSGLKTHLYTTDFNEIQQLMLRGWHLEGTAWSTRDITGDPVYRLYHPGLKVHLYTKDNNEYQVLAGRSWKQEGIAYRSSGNKEVYRLYHRGIKKHLYTTDANERTVLSSRGWTYEGIAWYVE